MYEGVLLRFALASLVVLSATAQESAHSKLSPDLQWRNANAGAQVLVQYAENASHGSTIKASALRHGRSAVQFERVRMMSLRATRALAEDLAADPDVEYIAPDRTVYASASATIPAPSIWSAIGFSPSQLALPVR